MQSDIQEDTVGASHLQHIGKQKTETNLERLSSLLTKKISINMLSL